MGTLGELLAVIGAPRVGKGGCAGASGRVPGRGGQPGGGRSFQGCGGGVCSGPGLFLLEVVLGKWLHVLALLGVKSWDLARRLGCWL